MANANSTLSSGAARLLAYSGHYSNIYQGTELELVTAGIIQSEWLPGVNGNAKTTTRIGMIDGEMRLLPFGVMATRAQEEDGLIHTCKVSKHKFRVSVKITKEERERRNEEDQRQR